MSDVNLVLFQGRLTRNPELRKTNSGVSVTDLSIASNRFVRKKNAPEGARGDDAYETFTTFARVTLWNKMAERYCEQLHKGDMVFIEGQLVDDSYEDKDGVKHNGRLKIDNVTRVNILARSSNKGETGSGSTSGTPEV